jgi:predicted AAA+ superfamily ATPase
MKRFQQEQIFNDLQQKVVLLVGPRQAGKTWLAKSLSVRFQSPLYLNYDRAKDREIIQKESWLEKTDFLILDEIHKMPEWKNYLKGVYDTKAEHLKILVTGSARLDILRFTGDSLAGRYFLHHLLPFSPSELFKIGESIDLDLLMMRSGFPEAMLSENETNVLRWRKQYINSLLTIDALELSEIQNISALKLIFELLRSRVGSPISYQSIAEDVAVSPHTVKRYIEILESLYVIFRITPFSKNIARSLQKEPKMYFFDSGLVNGDSGAKFENFTAGCLFKHILAKNDIEAQNYRLHYLRTKDGEEVDFALINNDEVETIIETKYANESIPKSLLQFRNKYQFPSILLVKELKREYVAHSIEVRSARHYLSELFL